MYLRCLDWRCAQAAVLQQYRCTLAIFELTHCVFGMRALLCIAMLDVRSCVFVTFELTRCVLAMLGFAICASGCTTSISLHTHSTCLLTHCVFGMLGVHGCAVAILDVRSCVLVIFELTRCVLAMLGVHGCANAMLDVRSCVFAIFELTCVMCARLCDCDVCRQLY